MEQKQSGAQRLLRLEADIRKGHTGIQYMSVGFALLEIKESRLYSPRFKDFKDYCINGLKKDYHRCCTLIGAAQVGQLLNNEPDNEATSRALEWAKSDEDKLWAVWNEIKKRFGTNPTRLMVAEVSHDLFPDERSLKVLENARRYHDNRDKANLSTLEYDELLRLGRLVNGNGKFGCDYNRTANTNEAKIDFIRANAVKRYGSESEKKLRELLAKVIAERKDRPVGKYGQRLKDTEHKTRIQQRWAAREAKVKLEKIEWALFKIVEISKLIGDISEGPIADFVKEYVATDVHGFEDKALRQLTTFLQGLRKELHANNYWKREDQ